jgi:hypothetical protein
MVRVFKPVLAARRSSFRFINAIVAVAKRVFENFIYCRKKVWPFADIRINP